MITPDFLFNRDPESHKGDYGHALLFAGSYGKMGAAILAARACLRSGVGLLTVHTPRAGVNVLQTSIPEAMVSIDKDECFFSSLPANLERYDAIAIGPGIGTGEATQNALMETLTVCHKQNKHLVLDADALNILAQHPESLHLALGAIITPHVKEYERLFADAEPQKMADIHNLIIVKKAHHTTIYAPNVRPVINNTGNAGMATAGSGDVLTGILLGVVSQSVAYQRRHNKESYNSMDIAALAVRLHGKAGDIASQRRPQASVIASDIIDALLI